jgi:glycosyltransferase involved in cell wall biosynthesis
MDAFVFPSETDTFGNVVLEAMASGVPVVVSKGGGPKFLVMSRQNGYIADNFETFVEALTDLRSHPHLRERMSAGARAAAMDHCWDSVFAKVYSRYDDVLVAGRDRAHRSQTSMVLAP